MTPDPHADWLARFDAASRERDTAGLVAGLIASDHVQEDHRPLGWEPVEGRDAMVAFMRSVKEMWPDEVIVERTLVVVRDEFHVAREVLRGVAVGGIETEAEWWAVRHVRDGVARRCDIFGEEAAAIAFAEELSSRTRRASHP